MLSLAVKNLSFTNELMTYYSYVSSQGGGSNSSIKDRMKKLIAIGIDTELTDRQKDCLTMRVYQGMSVEDIAAELGIRPTTVYKHIKKAKEALKKCRKYL